MDDTGRYVIALQNIHNVTRESTKGTKKDRFVITVYMNVRKLSINILGPNIHVHCYIHGLGTL